MGLISRLITDALTEIFLYELLLRIERGEINHETDSEIIGYLKQFQVKHNLVFSPSGWVLSDVSKMELLLKFYVALEEYELAAKLRDAIKHRTEVDK